jgi:hypothetical protein
MKPPRRKLPRKKRISFGTLLSALEGMERGLASIRPRAGALTKRDLIELDKIIMKNSEVGPFVETVIARLAKISAEVQTLKGTLTDAEVSPETKASLDRLDTATQALDDLNPDAAAENPPVPARKKTKS